MNFNDISFKLIEKFVFAIHKSFLYRILKKIGIVWLIGFFYHTYKNFIFKQREIFKIICRDYILPFLLSSFIFKKLRAIFEIIRCDYILPLLPIVVSVRKIFRLPVNLLHNVKNSTPLIVSLTSHPPRFTTIHKTLWILLHQTHKPDKIILWLAKDEVKDLPLPKSMLYLEQLGITIQWVEKSLKVYNKLIHSLINYPDACIVTCDDDVRYPKYWLKGLYQAHLETPKCVVSWGGKLLVKISDKSFASYLPLPPIHIKENEIAYSPNIVPEAIFGILYPPNSFNQEVFNSKNYLELAPTGDDIWYKAMLLLNNTPCRIFLKYKPWKLSILYVRKIQQVSLYSVNIVFVDNNNQYYDKCFKDVFDYYQLYDKIE